MNNLLYAAIVVLVILWTLGYFVFSLGNIVHLLLVIAITIILVNVIKENESI